MSFHTKLRPLAIAAAAAASIALVSTTPANAGSVENLERERAMVLQAILMPDLGPDERVSKIGASQRRLIDLERIVGAPVDPFRFRGNLLVSGLEPWAEFDWVDREVAVGSVRLRIDKRIQRCPATDVNPGTGARDMNIPMALKRGYGHTDMGVFATIIAGGTVAAGDEIIVG